MNTSYFTQNKWTQLADGWGKHGGLNTYFIRMENGVYTLSIHELRFGNVKMTKSFNTLEEVVAYYEMVV